MIHEKIHLLTKSGAYLTTYILEDEEYARKNKKKPAVIICPGGGYTFVSQNEGEPVALAFAAKGYHAFVLHYSVGIENPFPAALLELGKAVSIIRERSNEWNIEENDITVCGFSAGGHLAACLGTYFSQDFVTEALRTTPEILRPNALILGYPTFSLRTVRDGNELTDEMTKLMDQGLMPDFRGFNVRQILTGKPQYDEEDLAMINLLGNISSDMPPAFIFGSNRDTLIPPADLLEMTQKLYEKGVLCELHLFGFGPHGQGLYTPSCTDESLIEGNHMDSWFDLALSWLGESRAGYGL
jgi:acetyl esterase/lipase